MPSYPLLDVRITTPTLELRGAANDLLDELADVVRAGKANAEPAPYDDPISFYDPDPDLRVAKWLRAIWRGRGKVEPDAFVDNHGSNAISRDLGYEPNGSDWATRRGEPALLNRWRLTRDNWEQRRRDNIRLHNIEACRTSLPLT